MEIPLDMMFGLDSFERQLWFGGNGPFHVGDHLVLYASKYVQDGVQWYSVGKEEKTPSRQTTGSSRLARIISA